MRQASLKLKSYAQSVSIINNNAEALTLRFILGAFILLAMGYILILGNIVLNIIERRATETAVRNLSSEVSDLELNYLALSNNIDLDLSHNLGFREVKAQFATRKTLGALPNINLAQNDI
ncbi:MAG: hypothetical protein KA515_02985 [Candidatus Pacebacteria bacterium]|nr:hypothetical protein [Candidatus Paceibacterota bacterium]